MAKMIPQYISPDVKSNAEKKIFELLRDSNGLSEYTVLHSLGISRHSSKRQGEIDFVLIGKGTIICLEIKGGLVDRKDGIWCFTNRYGQETRKIEGPFVQVSSAMYSLKKDLEAKFGFKHGYLFGYGVVFPDCKFSKSSPEWDNKIIYDSSSADKPISQYVDRITSYWRQKTPQFNNLPVLPKSEVINYFRGDFESITPLWGEIRNTEEEIARFTTEQYRALDQMVENQKLIFTGVAGTGKTLLAIEQARRNYLNNKKTLVLCFNKFLGARLHQESKLIDPNCEYIQATSIHKFFWQIISRAGLKSQLDKQSTKINTHEFYNEVLPSLFVTAAEKVFTEKFDNLIIDEGQDLLTESYLLALDYILKGGFKKGSWTVFLDPGGQAKLFNRYSLEAYEYLKSLGAPVYKLDLNVRNTLQIATQASIISGFPAGKPKIEGPKVEFKLCIDKTDMALKTTELINKLLLEESISPSSITLLSSKNIGSMSLFATGVRVPRCLTEATEDNIIKTIPDKIYYTSVQSYKGLENSIIIYTDLDSFDGDFSESVNYVALTRARNKLYVLMNKNLNDAYQERVKKFVKDLV